MKTFTIDLQESQGLPDYMKNRFTRIPGLPDYMKTFTIGLQESQDYLII